jgi:tetratricopeptide (TPR) repeat protein
MRLDINDTNDAALVYPADRLRDVVAARVVPGTIDYAALNSFVPLTRKEFDEAVASDRAGAGLYRNRFAHTRAALAAARTYGAATTKLLPAVRPAFVSVYFDLVDTVSHLFTADPQRRDRAIGSAYSEIDQQIRAVARTLEPNTFVIVMSDHGFYRADAGVPDDPSDLTAGAAAWHRPYGIVAATTAAALAGTSAAPKLPPLGAVSPLDIAPSVLVRADLAVAGDMPGRVLNTLTGGARVTTIASYGAHQLPEQTSGDSRNNLIGATELERLRALGYVSGRSAVTTLARVNLGEILFRKGAIKEAIVQLEAALAADRLNQRAGLWLARAYASANRSEDAVRLYDRLLQTPAGAATVDPIIVLAVTDLDIARGQRTAAADRLARLPAALSRRPEATLARGALAEADRRPPDAERLFRAAYTAQPTNIEALSRLVDLLIRNGRGAAAAQVAGEAARRFPDSPERLALLGEAALGDRQLVEAARAFRQALVLAPDAASLRVELGRAELLQHHADAALEAIGDLSGHDADVVRGAAFSSKGNWPAAVLAYTRALGEGAPSTDLLNALGNAQIEAGRPADAVTMLERSLSLKADQPEIRALADRAREQARAARPR